MIIRVRNKEWEFIVNPIVRLPLRRYANCIWRSLFD